MRNIDKILVYLYYILIFSLHIIYNIYIIYMMIYFDKGRRLSLSIENYRNCDFGKNKTGF